MASPCPEFYYSASLTRPVIHRNRQYKPRRDRLRPSGWASGGRALWHVVKKLFAENPTRNAAMVPCHQEPSQHAGYPCPREVQRKRRSASHLSLTASINGEYEAKRLFEYLACRDLRRIDRARDLRKGGHIVLHFERDGVSNLQHLIVSDIKDERVKGYGFIRRPHAEVDNSRR